MVNKVLREDEDERNSTVEHTPSEIQRARVSLLAEAGVGQRAIAAEIGIAVNTLRRHYAMEIVKADVKVQALIGQAALQEALGAPAQYDKDGNQTRAEVRRNCAMLIFLCKSRLGYRDGGPGQIENGAQPDDGASFEFGTAGLTNSDRAGRIADLINRARARGAGRGIDGSDAMGAFPLKPATGGLGK